MSDGPSRLDEELLRKTLAEQAAGQVVVRDRVPSTNDVAWELATGGAPSWTVVAADEQTAGRGRHGRTWQSRAGLGLYVSVVTRPWTGHRAPGRWTLAAAVAAAESCRRVASVRAAAIKWPNDIVVGRRKLAGVLAESRSAGPLADVFVVGVGFNVHHQETDFTDELRPRATSAAIETGTAGCSRERLAADWVRRLIGLYESLARGEWSLVARRWDDIAVGAHGLRVVVEQQAPGGGGRFEGVTSGIDEDGLLRIRHADGAVRSVHAAASVRPRSLSEYSPVPANTRTGS